MPGFAGGQLLREGELAPGISVAEFAERRRRLCAALPPRAVALIPSASPAYYAAGIACPYRQVTKRAQSRMLDW